MDVPACSREGGLDTSVGRSSSIKPNCRTLIDNPWLAKLASKIGQMPVRQIFFNWKNTLNYFRLNTFGKVNFFLKLESSIGV
jgi:hypothetical protein